MYKWKGTDLSTKGIIVEKKPTISKGKKRIETYDIYGRNGFLSIDTGVYEPFEVSLECHLDTSVANLDEVKALLDGYGTLQFDSDRQYTAIVNNAIPFEVVATKFRSFIIQFLVNPIAIATTQTTVAITSNLQQFDITGSYSNPDCEIVLSSANAQTIIVTLNGTQFKLEMEANKTYTLYCTDKIIKDNLGNNASSKMGGDFPSLKNGTNTLTWTGSSLSTFNIKYRKTYL